MAATAKPVSNIAMAFAAAGTLPSSSVAIPPHKAPSGNPHHASGALPTPPNSISPTLPPHKVRSEQLHRASYPAPAQVDSDIDLHDADHRQDQDGDGATLQSLSSAALSALSGVDPTGAITPQMLAAHHLPEILLHNGPIAIRHVLAHLTQGVPGFARIPPAKARRLVVAALESRGGGGEHGEVVFEKVGWGRWDARLRGQGGRSVSGGSGSLGLSSRSDALSPPASVHGSYAISSAGDLQIPKSRVRRWSASNGDGSGSISGGMWAEHEADKMSLDGSEDSSPYAYEEPRIKEIPIDYGDSDDATDEEDWAGMGAHALRQASLSAPKAGAIYLPRVSASRIKMGNEVMAKSVPVPVPARPQQWRENRHVASSAGSRGPSVSRRGSSSYAHGHHPYANSVRASSVLNKQGVQGMDTVKEGQATGAQEREAIEALLKMGGM
ncbi:hypothetical protein NA57DRAFT_53842 [Rhizodiscina lignyota]|uniref:Sin3 binding protein n=1 Tax=Rhizodiscina lignyota TaxID=1504668 RepID=A0A9P4IL07_9PEZI|nr:hypothetical protein NA57DRAFT_53842 [Rhizodiscina lignyota]